MKKILLVSIACGFLFFGVGLSLAHGAPFEGQPGFPYIRNHYKGKPYKPGRTCKEYLGICERSCGERGNLAAFSCIEKNFQVWENKRFRCQCFDDFKVNP